MKRGCLRSEEEGSMLFLVSAIVIEHDTQHGNIAVWLQIIMLC